MTIEKRKYTILDIIRMPVRCAPVPSVLSGTQILVAGVVPTIQVLASAALIDTAVAIVRNKTDAALIIPSLLAVVGLIAFFWISGALSAFANVRLELAIREKFRTAIAEKRARLTYKHIESHETWDLITRVATTPESQIKTAYTDLLAMASNLLRVAGVLFLLIAHVWWAAFVIISLSVPLMMLAVKSGKATYDAGREVTKHKRRFEYLSEVLAGREMVDERSLFEYSGRINEAFRAQFDAARKIELKTRRKWFIKMKTGSLLFGLISVMIALVLLPPVLSGTITVGLFISLVNAAFSIVQMLSWDLTYSIDQLARHREYLKDVTTFGALEDLPGATDKPIAPPPAFESLVLRNVSFRYPGTESRVLNGISLRIEKGRHYAFVGVNGAGKTTIAKLITGLYNGFEGEILLNGKPIESYRACELKAFFSVVFQDFARYSLPLKDCIALGDVNGMEAGDPEGRLEGAIANAGLFETVARLPRGLNTPLGKIKESGQELSGGEWQRVAMGRAVINPAPLRILDEPTAALDPIGESRVYEEYGRISQGKTTIFISHRLGSTKLADEIFVMSGGRVAEQGTHRQLMEAKGIYAQMYESQRSWYQ